MVVDIKVQRLARYRTMWKTRGFSKITVDPEDVTGHQVSGTLVHSIDGVSIVRKKKPVAAEKFVARRTCRVATVNIII